MSAPPEDCGALLRALDTPEQQAEYLLRLGMQTPEQPGLRCPTYRIPGCRAALWVRAVCSGTTVVWQGDSDSALLRGVLVLYHRRYDGRSLREIRRDPPVFLEAISPEIFSPDLRRNGLAACYRRIAQTEILNTTEMRDLL